MVNAAGAAPPEQTVDWPEAGPIDLLVHDLPHAGAPTEWWYVNAHLSGPEGLELALFASFFRVVIRLDENREPVYAHSFTWALSDLSAKRYWADSRIDADAPRIGLEKLDRGEGVSDARLRRAMREVLERGRIPHPDRFFDGAIHVARDRLDLDYGGARFFKVQDGLYGLSIPPGRDRPGCELRFSLRKAPVRHGAGGVVKGVDGADMFYYFVPRCRVRGHVAVDGVALPVLGEGWYDHEFGRVPDEQTRSTAASDHARHAWTWLGIQLADGTDVTAYEMIRVDTGETVDKRALVITTDGSRHEYLDFELVPLETWRSTRTFNDYATAWRLTVAGAGADLTILACFEDQELITLISRPAFWEGRCDVRGSLRETPAAGRAYVERSGYSTVETMEEFFSAVGEKVRESVREILPRRLPYERARDLIAGNEREHYMDGVCLDALSRALAQPVREIVDRGGKAWRSYAALACCDVVGGDSREFVRWLAMPEFLHVGSLIVDDVEDRSGIRRGGPSCHRIFGEPIAINAGSACYFLGQRLLNGGGLSDAQKLQIYDLYFEALRAGHAGQALDLEGLGAAMTEAVESGHGDVLEGRVLAIHRLKTAVPAAALARMGAVAGRGTPEQIEALGAYFEAVGLAFQIMDDVLNARGFGRALKTRGEDLMRGQVTMPVAKAVSLMTPEARGGFWSRLCAKPQEPEAVAALVAELEACGALDACTRQAHDMVEGAWRRLDPQVEDSLPKIMIRAFGWFVLERHY